MNSPPAPCAFSLAHHGPCSTVGLIPAAGWVPQRAFTTSWAQLEREMGMLFLPCVEESLPALTSSLLQEILYVRLHQRIQLDASQHVSHSCTPQLRASLLGGMAESLERAEHPSPVLRATLAAHSHQQQLEVLCSQREHVLQTNTACRLCRAGNFCIPINSQRKGRRCCSPEGSLVQHTEAQGWLTSLWAQSSIFRDPGNPGWRAQAVMFGYVQREFNIFKLILSCTFLQIRVLFPGQWVHGVVGYCLGH